MLVENVRLNTDDPDAPPLVAGDKVKINRFHRQTYATPLSGNGRLIRMKIVDATDGELLECVRWSGEDWSETVEYVVRPPLLCDTVVSRDSVTFAYTDSQTRVATLDADEEDQVIVPKYLVDDIIFVANVDKTEIFDPDDAEKEIKLVDVNVDARTWCREYPV